MKIPELIKLLETLNPEMDILLASDSEGNEYKTIDCIMSDNGKYVIFPTDTIIEQD